MTSSYCSYYSGIMLLKSILLLALCVFSQAHYDEYDEHDAEPVNRLNIFNTTTQIDSFLAVSIFKSIKIQIVKKSHLFYFSPLGI